MDLLVDPKDFNFETVEVFLIDTQLLCNGVGRDGGFLFDALADFLFQFLFVAF